MHRAGEMPEFSKACSWEAEKKFHLPLLEYHKVHEFDTNLCSCRMSEKVLVVCGNSRGPTALFLRPWSHKSRSMGTSTHQKYELSARMLLKTGKPFFIEKVIWMIFSLTQVQAFLPSLSGLVPSWYEVGATWEQQENPAPTVRYHSNFFLMEQRL